MYKVYLFKKQTHECKKWSVVLDILAKAKFNYSYHILKYINGKSDIQLPWFVPNKRSTEYVSENSICHRLWE